MVLICREMRLKWPMSANSASAPADARCFDQRWEQSASCSMYNRPIIILECDTISHRSLVRGFSRRRVSASEQCMRAWEGVHSIQSAMEPSTLQPLEPLATISWPIRRLDRHAVKSLGGTPVMQSTMEPSSLQPLEPSRTKNIIQ